MKFQELFSQVPAIQERLAYTFTQPELLIRAFIHSSFLNEHRDTVFLDNERLEFLGDSILNFLVAEYLYKNLPDVTEGKLSSLRAHAVSSTACARYFDELHLQEFMLVGRGEVLQAGRGARSSIIADMFEALLGAIYLDGGLDQARKFLLTHFEHDLKDVLNSPEQNYKALLQEFTQKSWQKIPSYRVMQESGPDHDRQFCVGVFIEHECIGQGLGHNKKEAERLAAKQALDTLRGLS